MNTLRFLIMVVTGLMMLCGCSRTIPVGRSLPQDSLIQTLQDRLRLIRAAAPADDLRFAADLDPSPLVGIGREAIRVAFGSPDYCWTEVYSRPPCEEQGRWMYQFYHLPERSRGGGPELALTIGPLGRVDSARWIFTQ